MSRERAEIITKKLGFQFNVRQEAEGFSGGIWIYWSDGSISIQVLHQNSQIVHCSMKMDGYEGYMNVVYGSPNASRRKDLWAYLHLIGKCMRDKWILMGDFNSFLHPLNKTGDRPTTMEQCRDFNDCVLDCGLREVESYGAQYTWNRNGVYEKLDWGSLQLRMASSIPRCFGGFIALRTF